MADSAATMARQPARRQHQRIAAGQDHLADRRVGGEPRVGRLQLRLGQQAAVRADMLAAEAEAAIDRADQQRLQQRPVRDSGARRP